MYHDLAAAYKETNYPDTISYSADYGTRQIRKRKAVSLSGESDLHTFGLARLLDGATYREIPVQSMVNKIAESISLLVESVTTNCDGSFVVRIDGERLKNELLRQIPWASLLSNHRDVAVSRLDLLLDYFSDRNTKLWQHCPSVLFAIALRMYCGLKKDRNNCRSRIVQLLDDLWNATPGLHNPPRFHAIAESTLFSPFFVPTDAHAQLIQQLASHWFRRFPEYRLLWLRVLFRLIVQLDRRLILNERQNTENFETGNSEVRSPSRPTPFNVAYLHSELSEEEAVQFEKGVVRFSSVDKGNAAVSTARPQLTWKCQSRILHITIEFAKSLCVLHQPILPRPSNMTHAILGALFSSIGISFSPSLCYCAMLLHHELPGGSVPNMMHSVELAWTFAKQQSNPKTLLGYYTTLISESAVFDDPHALKEATFPLLENIVSSLYNDTYHEAWRRILVCRGKMIQQCGTGDFRSLFLESLHGVSLRAALATIDPYNGHFRDMVQNHSLPFEHTASTLLSRYSPRNRVPRGIQPHASSKFDPLNSDVLIQVFSFLNYKRLVKVRVVCSVWKTLSDTDSFWRMLYQRRYPSSHFHMNTWRESFVTRYCAEKAIQGQFCRTKPNWKVRLCPHCLTVLRTPHRAKKHTSTCTSIRPVNSSRKKYSATNTPIDS